MREQNHTNEQLPPKVNRRKFLQLAGSMITSALLAACGPDATPTPTANPTRVKTNRTPTPAEATAIPTRQEATKTPPPPTPEITVTPTPVPTEVTTLSTDVVDIMKTTGEKIIFDQRLLEYAKTQILDSGLKGRIKAIVIVNPNDPVLNVNPENYPGIGIGEKLAAITVPLEKPEKGVIIYIANTKTLNNKIILHEIGHTAFPPMNTTIDFDTKPFNDDYWFKHFQLYLHRLPPEMQGYELSLFYLFPYEENIINGACVRIGRKGWHDFFSAFGSLPFGSTQDSIPDEGLETLYDSLPQNSLQQQAVKWRMQEVDRLKKGGKTPEVKGFTQSSWGRFLLQAYFEHTDMVEKYLPSLYQEIKDTAIQTFSSAQIEVWADLWAERVLNPDNARKLYPLGVQTQERVIEFLKTKQKN